MAQYSIAEISDALGTEAAGDLALVVMGVAEPASATADHLALAMEAGFGADLAKGQAKAAIVWQGADWQALGLKAAIFAPRSRYVMSGVTHIFEHHPDIAPGIHSSAIVHPTAELGADCAIGAFCLIGAGVKIGAKTRIASHCTISEGSEIGENALLYSGVRIGARVRIGAGFIAQPNAVIGADGFSYVTPKPGAVEEVRATGKITEASRTDGFARINSLGTVVIGDRVEVGANCTIDRGTIADTTIGHGTKLDNLVHVGHNVTIGQNCLLCGQVGVAGSTKIGDRVVFAGHVGVADHVTIGSDVIVAGKSAVYGNVASGQVMMGNPAVKMDINIKTYKALRRLPRLFETVAELSKAITQSGKAK